MPPETYSAAPRASTMRARVAMQGCTRNRAVTRPNKPPLTPPMSKHSGNIHQRQAIGEDAIDRCLSQRVPMRAKLEERVIGVEDVADDQHQHQRDQRPGGEGGQRFLPRTRLGGGNCLLMRWVEARDAQCFCSVRRSTLGARP